MSLKLRKIKQNNQVAKNIRLYYKIINTKTYDVKLMHE